MLKGEGEGRVGLDGFVLSVMGLAVLPRLDLDGYRCWGDGRVIKQRNGERGGYGLSCVISCVFNVSLAGLLALVLSVIAE